MNRREKRSVLLVTPSGGTRYSPEVSFPVFIGTASFSVDSQTANDYSHQRDVMQTPVPLGKREIFAFSIHTPKKEMLT